MGVVSCGTTMLDQGVFQNIGAVTWDTTAKTAGFTAVSNNGYFVNTTSGAITVTLPSSPAAGAIVGIKDYANTADTNAITIGRNGSNIQGSANDYLINTEGRSVILVYVDATKGWLVTSASQASDITSPFIQATGGTITTSGNCKIHTFTGPGTFCISSAAICAANNVVSYMVVAGGGGAAAGHNEVKAGGGGAGGFREYKSPVSCYTASPLNGNPGGTAITVTASSYPVTVGAGGGGVKTACLSPIGNTNTTNASKGSNSVFSTITSTGGGQSGTYGNSGGQPGGSGGGRGTWTPPAANTGSGNTPPVSPPQGNNGGCASPYPAPGGGGGGGATVAGGAASPTTGGAGGAGATTSISGSPTAYAGGGGGGGNTVKGPGGSGGGGNGGRNSPATPTAAEAYGTNGTTNTGGGGGGASSAGGTPTNYSDGGNGGSGIVIIRYKYQ